MLCWILKNETLDRYQILSINKKCQRKLVAKAKISIDRILDLDVMKRISRDNQE